MKIKRSLISNESGMSLVQVVIAAGIMSMLAVVMMKMQENQTKTQNDIGAKAEIVSIMQKMNSLMGSPGYCTENLKGKRVSADGELELNEIVSPTGKSMFKVGEIYGDRQVILKGIEQKEFFFDDEEKTRGILSFTVSLEKKKKSFGAKVIKKTLEVFVNVNELGTIEGCSSSGSVLSAGAGSNAIDSATVQEVIKKGISGESVEGVSEKQIKKIIESNPALREMQEAIKNMNKSNEQMEKIFKE